ncbi:TIGR03086 family metal-binding protein [Nocardia panacis]|uniref:TIGR03086 family metal-binding protein n=1 Tax=Nocardia panacis TaxID=2340916 RepID=UPI00193A754B|nr:TIGR03086 family metal-binding protein [Nocardia panacis]
MDTIELLGRAVDQLGTVIADIRPEQADLPTPCADWDVRALAQHVIGLDLRNFLVSARGERPDWQEPADPLGPDWSADYAAASAPLLPVWRAADLDGPLRSSLDQQIAELTAHSWDLARATNQPTPLDPALAEHSLAWARTALLPEYRGAGMGFGPEVPVAADAPVYDRLAAWFGRNPAWPF